MVEGFRGDTGLVQAPGDGVVWKGGVVLLAGEALFLRGGDDAAVLDQRGRAVVVEGRYTEDTHGSPKSPVRTACR